MFLFFRFKCSEAQTCETQENVFKCAFRAFVSPFDKTLVFVSKHNNGPKDEFLFLRFACASKQKTKTLLLWIAASNFRLSYTTRDFWTTLALTKMLPSSSRVWSQENGGCSSTAYKLRHVFHFIHFYEDVHCVNSKFEELKNKKQKHT